MAPNRYKSLVAYAECEFVGGIVGEIQQGRKRVQLQRIFALEWTHNPKYNTRGISSSRARGGGGGGGGGDSGGSGGDSSSGKSATVFQSGSSFTETIDILDAPVKR